MITPEDIELLGAAAQWHSAEVPTPLDARCLRLATILLAVDETGRRALAAVMSAIVENDPRVLLALGTQAAHGALLAELDDEESA